MTPPAQSPTGTFNGLIKEVPHLSISPMQELGIFVVPKAANLTVLTTDDTIATRSISANHRIWQATS